MAKTTINTTDIERSFPSYIFQVRRTLRRDPDTEMAARVARMGPDFYDSGPAIRVREQCHFYGLIPGKVVTTAYFITKTRKIHFKPECAEGNLKEALTELLVTNPETCLQN